MTYCVGMLLDQGLVMASDSRTNAGLDHISTFRKMWVWERPGDRVIVMLTAGNLAITQAVANLLAEGVEAENGDKGETLHTVPSMFAAARLVGAAVREIRRMDAEALAAADTDFNATMILGGQIAGRAMRLFQIYAAGNFIEATGDTPFFQIGETKYGKPILDRVLNHETALDDAVKLALVSMDSTLRSNISAGPPIDLLTYLRDSGEVAIQVRIDEDDAYFNELRRRWSENLKRAFDDLPPPPYGPKGAGGGKVSSRPTPMPTAR